MGSEINTVVPFKLELVVARIEAVVVVEVVVNKATIKERDVEEVVCKIEAAFAVDK